MSAFQLRTLSPDIDGGTFVLCLAAAYSWIIRRPWAYVHTGGKLSWAEYLDRARRPEQSNVAIFVGDQMASLITIEQEPDGIYLFHITSPRRTTLKLIVDATYQVGWLMFAYAGAQKIYTMVPAFGSRHLHLGSRRLCEAVGMRATGRTETDEYSNTWHKFEIDRATWVRDHYGQEDNRAKPAINDEYDAAANGFATGV